MDMAELEEALAEILTGGFQIEADNQGQLVIYTGLTQDDDGELVAFEDDEEDTDLDPSPDFESYSEDDEEE